MKVVSFVHDRTRIAGHKIYRRMKTLREDQRGLETLQVVLIIAVAAVILALLVNMWPNIRNWASGAIDYITGNQDMGAGQSSSDGTATAHGGP